MHYLGRFTWEPLLGNLDLGSFIWDALLGNIYLGTLLGKLYLGSFTLEHLLGNLYLGTLGEPFLELLRSDPNLTMPEDPSASAVGEN
jgi:hypothetical protein